MKTKNQHKALFTALTLLLVLAGCGLKGRLYQPPGAESTAKVATVADTKTNTKTNTKVNTKKLQKTESVVQADEVILKASGNPEDNENEHISKEHE